MKVQKQLQKRIFPFIKALKKEFSEFASFFVFSYCKKKLTAWTEVFENNKNILVRRILLRRGRINRLFLHLCAMLVLFLGVVISPLVSDSAFFSNEESKLLTFAQEDGPDLVPDDVFETQSSDKPRSEIITYTVERGDTISSIGQKFGISVDTIKWANELKSDYLNIGDTLKILPVTGVVHKVERGDTVYTIAKKYDTNSQGIVDFTFNDFANPQTFSLVQGQILIVPDGVKPAQRPRYVRQTYIATGPLTITDAGFTWPLFGTINQLYTWYHKGIDIGAPTGSAIVSAQSGTVSEVYIGGWNGGYGKHVIIAGDNGYSTLYAHLSDVNVSVGDVVSAGKSIIGWVGLTGRTTGSHLHLEIRGPGGFLNPRSFLQ